jgi:hypothetical protein
VTLGFPSWWKGFRWDVERLMRDLFLFDENKAAQEITGLKVEPFTPPTEERETWIRDGNGFLFVHRRGGSLDKSTAPLVDRSITELAALTKSRDDSNELISYVADILSTGYGEDGGTVRRSVPHRSGLSTTFLKVPGEVVGPQLIPELIRDERYVSTTWNLHADLPHSLPDTREVLGLDD